MRMERAVDWVIGLVNPRRAALRGHFRRFEGDPDYRQAVLALMNARGYRGAAGPATQTPWFGGNRSADAEIINDLPKLISRSRELNREDPIASGLTDTFVTNVVGTGMRPQARATTAALNDGLEEIWAERADRLALADDVTQGELQRLWFRKVIEDGGVLVKRAKRGPDEALWFETIEKDRLRTPVDATPAAGGEIRDGVEKDGDGVPVAYWVSRRHPGETLGGLLAKAVDFTRVLASEVCHLRTVERPGQTHGVPIFHAILQDLRDLDLLLLAALKRTQVAACLAAFIKSPMPTTDVIQVTAQKYGYKLDQALEPGMLFKLYPEETIETLIPNFPTPELGPFIVMLARRIGAALGVSWQIVLKDFSEANYSSARTDLLESRAMWGIWQAWFVEKCLRWVWRSVMDDAALRGDRRAAGASPAERSRVHWIPNGWRWVDPLKEAQGKEIELRIGLTTLREECGAQGRDWEEVLIQRLTEEKREAELREEMGLPPKPAAQAPARTIPSADEVAEALAEMGGGGARGGNGRDHGRPVRLGRLLEDVE